MEQFHNQKFGSQGESLALVFLKKRGLVWLASNFRTRWGEIDLIMRDGNTLVFVEVKRREGARYGDPEAAVHEMKRAHMVKAAMMYVLRTGQTESNIRFDVVSIGPDGFRHIENAFEVDGSHFYY